MFNWINNIFTKKNKNIKINISEQYDGSGRLSKKFTIPVGRMNKKESEKLISDLMMKYKDDVNFDENTGEILLNGEKMKPYKKEYWIPIEKENKKSFWKIF